MSDTQGSDRPHGGSGPRGGSGPGGGGPFGGGPFGGGPFGGGRGGKLFDDLAGVAGGAFSVLAGARAEIEAMARSQADALVQRLDLVKREELDAAMEVARRAREGQEALEARVKALEERLGAQDKPMIGDFPDNQGPMIA